LDYVSASKNLLDDCCNEHGVVVDGMREIWNIP